MADRPSLDGRVGFIPFQADPADVFRSLDVVVHASTHPEPFGRTIVEGMACGRPVIVSQAGGASELFTDGVDALGFLPGDAGSLASAIRRLATDPASRARLGSAARLTASERFDRRRMGREVAGHLAKLAGREREFVGRNGAGGAGSNQGHDLGT